MIALTDKTILITGASGGIGREVALRLSKRNNRLVITARREAVLEALKQEIEANGSECLAVAADSVDQAAVEGLLAKTFERFAQVDVALLNAGGGKPLDLTEADTDGLKRLIATNLDTLTNYLSPLIAHMKQRGSGTIAYTCSPASYFGLPTSGAYCAAKAAGRVLMESCRVDLHGSGIKFVSIYPGFAYTGSFTEEDRVTAGIPRFMVIDKQRAATEVIYAIERQKLNHFFPKRLKVVHGLGRLLPEGLRARILAP